MKLPQIFNSKQDNETAVFSRYPDVRTDDLLRGFIIFSIIYFPISFLFRFSGSLERSLLAFYTLVLFVAASALIYKFLIILARSANDKHGYLGSIFAYYFSYLFYPLLIIKFIINNIYNLLPRNCYGLLLDLKRFIIDFYNLYRPAYYVDQILFYSLIAICSITLIAIFWRSIKEK